MELFCETSKWFLALVVNYFDKKNFILDVRLGSKHASFYLFYILDYWLTVRSTVLKHETPQFDALRKIKNQLYVNLLLSNVNYFLVKIFLEVDRKRKAFFIVE